MVSFLREQRNYVVQNSNLLGAFLIRVSHERMQRSSSVYSTLLVIEHDGNTEQRYEGWAADVLLESMVRTTSENDNLNKQINTSKHFASETSWCHLQSETTTRYLGCTPLHAPASYTSPSCVVPGPGAFLEGNDRSDSAIVDYVTNTTKTMSGNSFGLLYLQVV